MNHTFSILFYLKKDFRKKSNKAHIFFRITVDGKRSEQSIQRMIEIERWDAKAGRVRGNRADAKVVNDLSYRHDSSEDQ